MSYADASARQHPTVPAIFQFIKKRNQNVIPFESSKITSAIFRAGQASGEFDQPEARRLTIRVLSMAQNIYTRQTMEVEENSNMSYSLQGLNNYIASEIGKTYWLNPIYSKEVRKAHEIGDLQIKERFDCFWKNHFSAIGLSGANEAAKNLLGCDIGTKKGQHFAIRIMDHMRKKLQERYTGGTVVHFFLGESVPDSQAIKSFVRAVCQHYKLPYFTLTPSFSICKIHGYLRGKQTSIRLSLILYKRSGRFTICPTALYNRTCCDNEKQ